MSCPICGRPMPTETLDGKPRQVCSQTCAAHLNRSQQRCYSTEVDPVIVDRLIHGDHHGTVTHAELSQAVDYLTRHGYTSTQIAARLHITRRTVHRHRSALRSAA